MTTSEHDTLAQRLTALQQDIASHTHQQESIPTLLAVSKKQPTSKIRALYAAGQRAFAENYLQEALAKQAELSDLTALEWHFIGPIQSNKTHDIAQYFDWIHSVDRTKIAERLSNQRPASSPPLNICVQVNIDNSPTKSGVSPAEAAALCHTVYHLPQLQLRGLMCIPEPRSDFSAQQAVFAELAALRDAIRAQLTPVDATTDHLTLDTLSMGMSADYPAAIAAGATIIRIGTRLFGPRPT